MYAGAGRNYCHTALIWSTQKAECVRGNFTRYLRLIFTREYHISVRAFEFILHLVEDAKLSGATRK